MFMIFSNRQRRSHRINELMINIQSNCTLSFPQFIKPIDFAFFKNAIGITLKRAHPNILRKRTAQKARVLTIVSTIQAYNTSTNLKARTMTDQH